MLRGLASPRARHSRLTGSTASTSVALIILRAVDLAWRLIGFVTNLHELCGLNHRAAPGGSRAAVLIVLNAPRELMPTPITKKGYETLKAELDRLVADVAD